MDMKNNNDAVVERYLKCPESGAVSRDLAEKAPFDDRLAGRGSGSNDFRALVSGFLPAIDRITIIQHICEGEFVTTYFIVGSPFGPLPILCKLRIMDGRIWETYLFNDPRPFFGGR
jgi:hypothetical protein